MSANTQDDFYYRVSDIRSVFLAHIISQINQIARQKKCPSGVWITIVIKLLLPLNLMQNLFRWRDGIFKKSSMRMIK